MGVGATHLSESSEFSSIRLSFAVSHVISGVDSVVDCVLCVVCFIYNV